MVSIVRSPSHLALSKGVYGPIYLLLSGKSWYPGIERANLMLPQLYLDAPKLYNPQSVYAIFILNPQIPSLENYIHQVYL